MSDEGDWRPHEGEDAIAWIDRLLNLEALSALIAKFDGPARNGAALGDWLAMLDSFSEVWDYRSGKERNLVDARAFDAATDELTAAAAHGLGLIGTNEPLHREYDQILVLGGLLRACIARPLHASQLLKSGISATHVIALGGFRELRGDEIELSANVLPDAPPSDEFGAMSAGMRSAFELADPIETAGEMHAAVGASWRADSFAPIDSGARCSVVAAPSSQPGIRRANTADTYAWIAAQPDFMARGDRTLLVTTAIYRTFQFADAWRMLELPFGIDLDVVGARPGDIDSRLRQEFGTHHYLQEIRSAIRALKKLFERAT